jgi:hypothetical protein
VARVEHDHVGFFELRGFPEPFGRKRVRHTMRIVDVHLATKGFDVNLALCLQHQQLT